MSRKPRRNRREEPYLHSKWLREHSSKLWIQQRTAKLDLGLLFSSGRDESLEKSSLYLYPAHLSVCLHHFCCTRRETAAVKPPDRSERLRIGKTQTPASVSNPAVMNSTAKRRTERAYLPLRTSAPTEQH
ncbi:hypothetical protein SRHO_G00104560 [Serrasalmus rhombeus]